MIEMIVFDIGGVFFHQTEAVLDDICAHHSIVRETLGDVLFKSDLWDQHKRGKLSEDAYWTEIGLRLPETAGRRPIEQLRTAMEYAFIVDEPLIRLVRTLGISFRIAALSNAGPELERRLEKLHMMDLFERVINSHYVKMAKPDRDIYEYTVELLGVTPNKVLFVDDKERNTRVADALGFQTHIYTDADQFFNELSQRRLI